MNFKGRDRLLTIDQAAKRLAVHPDTIRRRIRNGRLPALKIPSSSKYGVRYRISLAELEKFARRNLTTATAASPPIASQVPRGTHPIAPRVFPQHIKQEKG